MENDGDIYKQPLGCGDYDKQIAALKKGFELFQTNRYLCTKPPPPPKEPKPPKPGSKKKPCAPKPPKPRKPRIIKFQRAGQIAINAVIALQKYMKEKYDVPFLVTYNTSQDFLERYFGEIRDMDGTNRDPSALQLIYRVSRALIRELLKVISSALLVITRWALISRAGMGQTLLGFESSWVFHKQLFRVSGFVLRVFGFDLGNEFSILI